MTRKQTIELACRGGIEAFLPLHLREIVNRKVLPTWSGTTSTEFELACQRGERGDLVLLKGTYETLIRSSFSNCESSEELLRAMMTTPRCVAVLCSLETLIELDGAPSISTIRRSSIVPTDWLERYYLLSLAGFADLELRRLYEEQGIHIPMLSKRLMVRFGVFVPDLSLVRVFLRAVDQLKKQGEDDFSSKSVCDTFAGSGVFGFLAADLGAKSVHFVDIDNLANSCISGNILELNPDCETSIHHADIFPGSRILLDTVVANPPWKDVYRVREYSHQFIDPERRILKRFFERVNDYLADDGAIYLFYETSGRHLVYQHSGGNFDIQEFEADVKGAARRLFRLKRKAPN